MDCSPSQSSNVVNFLTVNLNLASFTKSQDILHLDFAYLNHGAEQSASDQVWIRTSATQNWIAIYDLYANRPAPGTWKVVSELDLTNLVELYGLDYSETFQIRFGQEDNDEALTRSRWDGFTIDDIRISRQLMTNLAVKSILSPKNGGRVFTQTALTEYEMVSVLIENKGEVNEAARKKKTKINLCKKKFNQTKQRYHSTTSRCCIA